MIATFAFASNTRPRDVLLPSAIIGVPNPQPRDSPAAFAMRGECEIVPTSIRGQTTPAPKAHMMSTMPAFMGHAMGFPMHYGMNTMGMCYMGHGQHPMHMPMMHPMMNGVSQTGDGASGGPPMGDGNEAKRAIRWAGAGDEAGPQGCSRVDAGNEVGPRVLTRRCGQ